MFVEEQVLGFEVAMHDAIFVDVLHAGEYLLHEGDRFEFIESFLFDDVVEQFSSGCILHDEVDVGFGFDDLGG